MNDPLLAWRKEFPILAHTTYMISHSLGAMPRRVSERLQQFADTWATRGIRAWEEGWWEMPVTVGDLIGSIIGAGQGEVVMHQNVSICQWIVASCFDWRGHAQQAGDRRSELSFERLHLLRPGTAGRAWLRACLGRRHDAAARSDAGGN